VLGALGKDEETNDVGLFILHLFLAKLYTNQTKKATQLLNEPKKKLTKESLICEVR